MNTVRHLGWLLLSAGLVTSSLFGSIGLSNASPEVGEVITITTTELVDSLRVTYRPSSSVSRTEWIVNTRPDSVFRWTAGDPGLVQLSYRSPSATVPVTRNVSVRYRGLSVSGLVVMFLAGTILFGSVILAFRTLFQDQEEDGTLDLVPEELPDT